MIRIVSILTLFAAFNLAAQTIATPLVGLKTNQAEANKREVCLHIVGDNTNNGSKSPLQWRGDLGVRQKEHTTNFSQSQKSPSINNLPLSFSFGEGAQRADEAIREGFRERLQKDTFAKHSPKRASIYSALLPGLGQAYNRKYWKIPIVFAGLGVSGYYILENRKQMRCRQDALIARLDNDSTTFPKTEFAAISIDILTSDRNLYRTYRDYSIIAFAAIYLLNIVDASVDAHFYKFNIDKPLAMQKKRHLYFASSKVLGKPTLGLAYRW